MSPASWSSHSARTVIFPDCGSANKAQSGKIMVLGRVGKMPPLTPAFTQTFVGILPTGLNHRRLFSSNLKNRIFPKNPISDAPDSIHVLPSCSAINTRWIMRLPTLRVQPLHCQNRGFTRMAPISRMRCRCVQAWGCNISGCRHTGWKIRVIRVICVNQRFWQYAPRKRQATADSFDSIYVLPSPTYKDFI